MDFLFGNRRVDALLDGLGGAVVIREDGDAHGEGLGGRGQSRQHEMVEGGDGGRGGGSGSRGAESLHEGHGFDGGGEGTVGRGDGAFVGEFGGELMMGGWLVSLGFACENERRGVGWGI